MQAESSATPVLFLVPAESEFCAEVTRMVARANPQLRLADRVQLEANGCVHFEIR
jgi:hypothetical protein